MNPLQPFWDALGQHSPGSAFAGLPKPIMPPLSVSEFDKKIQELETVLGWMKMNMQMMELSLQNFPPTTRIDDDDGKFGIPPPNPPKANPVRVLASVQARRLNRLQRPPPKIPPTCPTLQQRRFPP